VEAWRRALNGDPLPWLLDDEVPAVKHLALRLLLDEPEDAAAVRRARAKAMRAHPIASILERQEAEGWWIKPGSGYSPKYTSTVWSLIFLDQLGADPRDPRVRRGVEYALKHTAAPGGGFGWNATPSGVVHCLNGNLLRAVIGFGFLDDPRTRAAVEWEARAITGEGVERWYPSATSGPGFSCGVNGTLPCGWGANKALRGLARIPPRRRTRSVRRAIDDSVAFLLSIDPATAAYPTDTEISRSWFRLGFPLGYVGDVLETLEALGDAGYARDARVSNAIGFVLSKQNGQGRWRNRHAYNRKTWGDIERQGEPSRWVTLRACAFLKRALG